MNILEEIKNKYADQVTIVTKSSQRAYATVPKSICAELVLNLVFEKGARLSTISGVDTRDGVEVLYHIALDQQGLLLTVKTLAKKPELQLDSLANKLLAADWIEREIHEMLGVDFIGHPNLDKLLLPDDWPKGEYPYRKHTFGSQKENQENE